MSFLDQLRSARDSFEWISAEKVFQDAINKKYEELKEMILLSVAGYGNKAFLENVVTGEYLFRSGVGYYDADYVERVRVRETDLYVFSPASGSDVYLSLQEPCEMTVTEKLGTLSPLASLKLTAAGRHIIEELTKLAAADAISLQFYPAVTNNHGTQQLPAFEEEAHIFSADVSGGLLVHYEIDLGEKQAKEADDTAAEEITEEVAEEVAEDTAEAAAEEVAGK